LQLGFYTRDYGTDVLDSVLADLLDVLAQNVFAAIQAQKLAIDQSFLELMGLDGKANSSRRSDIDFDIQSIKLPAIRSFADRALRRPYLAWYEIGASLGELETGRGGLSESTIVKIFARLGNAITECSPEHVRAVPALSELVKRLGSASPTVAIFGDLLPASPQGSISIVWPASDVRRFFDAMVAGAYELRDLAVDNDQRRPDTKTDRVKKVLSTRLPANSHIIQLASLIKNDKNGRSKIEIAQGFAERYGENAESLLRGLRRYPHLLM